MAGQIAIWDSDQVFHFLSSEHVSTRVRQLLLDAGLDGDMLLTFDKQDYIKGILHQKKFYRLNLIFWIVMGCGIAHFGRRRLFSHKCQIFICHNSTRMVA